MFQKVHFRLAALCGGITTFILLLMSLGYLYISEQGLKTSSFISFQNDMNTLINNLDGQTVITHEWIAKMESNGKYQIQITDNGIPFLYNERESEEEKQLFQNVQTYYEENYAPEEEDSFSPELSHTEFTFSSAAAPSGDYYVCVAGAQRKNSVFQMIVIAPLYALKRQIYMQRFLFLLLDIAAIMALSFFAWYFTKRILKPLKENQKKQMQFIASASHELRTPLAVILSCASASQHADGEGREHFLSSIQSEGLRMSRLIDDMLLLTTADNHSWTIRKTPVEPDTMLLNTFETFQPLAAEKSIRLTVSIPEGSVPPLLCDRERISQVLAILLHNAVSYTPEGGKIHLSLSCQGKNILFSVQDNGIGIPDAEKKAVFDRFYRSENSRSQKEHFGLGLCIADEIVRAHRGRITVSDTPGGGSTFTVIL